MHMPGDMTADQVIFFIILAAAFALLITEKLRNDIVAILIVLSLFVTGLLNADEAVQGFSSEPALVVAAIFVLSGALHQTGVSDTIGRWIGRLAGTGYTRAIAVIMPSVALLSAFTHHLTTTAVMLPVTMTLSREREIAPSKLLMPLAFAASLGTTITIIGAPAFLIASGVLRQAGQPGLGIFSIAPIGLALTVAGTAFVLLAGRFLLPARRGEEDATNRFRLDDYFTEVKVVDGSPIAGRSVEDVQADERYGFTVVDCLRGGRPLPSSHEPLRGGDVLLVRTTPEQLVQIRQESGLELHPVDQYGQDAATSDGDAEEIAGKLVQAVVAPGSDLVNRTLGEIDFRRRFGAIVVSIWRRDGWIRDEMARVRLRAGDVLVLQGNDEALQRVDADPAILMIVPFQSEVRVRNKGRLAALIMAGTVAAAMIDVQMATLGGAVAMVLAGCLSARQAYRAIDPRIYVFIAGAIPLGTAMQASGASDLVAGRLEQLVGGWNPTLVLLVLFWIVAVLTQFMSDAATTALFGPVAVALAMAMGQRPEAFVVTVAMAAVASFLTPIGHHGNLLIYGPGGYRFTDFVRVGAPLTAIVSVIVVLLSQMLWPA
jgi:di/tricarboxylate transporter